MGMFVTSFINIFNLEFLSYLCNNNTVLYNCIEILERIIIYLFYFVSFS